jgi:hypothetical protein
VEQICERYNLVSKETHDNQRDGNQHMWVAYQKKIYRDKGYQ